MDIWEALLMNLACFLLIKNCFGALKGEDNHPWIHSMNTWSDNSLSAKQGKKYINVCHIVLWETAALLDLISLLYKSLYVSNLLMQILFPCRIRMLQDNIPQKSPVSEAQVKCLPFIMVWEPFLSGFIPHHDKLISGYERSHTTWAR